MRCLRPCTPPVRLFSVYSLRVQPSIRQTSSTLEAGKAEKMKQKYNKNNPASSHRAAPRRKRESVRPPPGSFFYLQAVCTTHNGTTETQLRTINSANQQPTNRKKRRLATRPKHQHRQHYRMQPRRAPRRWANHRTCGTSLSGARRPGEMRYFQISPARAPVRSIHHHCNHAPALWQR